MTLSSSEAERVALLEAVKKSNICNPIIGKHESFVKLPVTLRVDVIEAIFLANNAMD